MKKIIISIALLGLFSLGGLALLGATNDNNQRQESVSSSPSPSVVKGRLDSEAIFKLINKYRIEKGLEPFTKSEELCGLAAKRADFFIKDEMKSWNDTPGYEHPGIEEFRKLYSGKAMGENLGAYAKDNEQAAYGWKDSPKHNKNLLATGWNGVKVNKGCVATREIPGHNVVVLLIGDK